jgi:hypothetical protein
MANTQAVCTSNKVAQVAAAIAGAPKAALYLASATVNAATTAYSATGEVTGAGYTAGGAAFTWAAAAATGTTAFSTPTAALSWTGLTAGPFDAVLLYNSTGGAAVAVYTFGAQTVTASNFSLTMPANDATNGLLRLA